MLEGKCINTKRLGHTFDQVLMSCENEALRAMGISLNTLYEERKHADYDLKKKMKSIKARQQHEFAVKLVQDLEDLCQSDAEKEFIEKAQSFRNFG